MKVLRAPSGPERIVKALRGDRKPEGLADGRHRSRKEKGPEGKGRTGPSMIPTLWGRCGKVGFYEARQTLKRAGEN